MYDYISKSSLNIIIFLFVRFNATLGFCFGFCFRFVFFILFYTYLILFVANNSHLYAFTNNLVNYNCILQ